MEGCVSSGRVSLPATNPGSLEWTLRGELAMEEVLHAAGCSIPYTTVRHIETTIDQKSVEQFTECGVVIPRNLVPGQLIQFSADNIDISEETLAGKQMFHATQMLPLVGMRLQRNHVLNTFPDFVSLLCLILHCNDARSLQTSFSLVSLVNPVASLTRSRVFSRLLSRLRNALNSRLLTRRHVAA
ncbi:hypothetical protein PR048_015502 [Dryococelus australis]|uniref:Uncharacterized protein n=1 Tax=Dryococelus australis TaxID=614101 RepID=A0ABQ9HH39_9NEOP|nr:hypothetical protein PR048_015502 [Dryococelus australis]